MKIHDAPQGSGAWLAARAGLPTASEFGNIVTPKFAARTGEMRQTYLCRLLAERLLGHPLGDIDTWMMERGQILEGEAIPWYELDHCVDVRRVGLVTTGDGRLGCSPDGLVRQRGAVEIKCPGPAKHVKRLLAGAIPEEHAAQVYGVMLICELEWIDYVSYCPGLPALVLRVERECTDTIGKLAMLRAAVDAFAEELDRAEQMLRARMVA